MYSLTVHYNSTTYRQELGQEGVKRQVLRKNASFKKKKKKQDYLTLQEQINY